MQGEGLAVLEESYAKQISLLVDSASPGMKITLDMEDALEEAERNNYDHNNIVSIRGNQILFKLSEDSGYTYSYFNDVDVTVDIVPKGGGISGYAVIYVN
jgi:hypothetical protein